MTRPCRVAVATALALGAWMPVAPARAEACPNPESCPLFEFEGVRWDLGANETATVPYFINPKQPWVPESVAIDAINAAFTNWSDAAPSVRFEYQGRTPLLPISGDGVNVIGFIDLWQFATHSAVTLYQADGGYLREVDGAFNAYFAWTWRPCEKRTGSCGPTPQRDFLTEHYLTGDVWPFANGYRALPQQDIEDTMTHEVGHMIGLDHVPAGGGSLLTMYPTWQPGVVQRHRTTLGLGDVLGARSLYPDKSAPPVVVVP